MAPPEVSFWYITGVGSSCCSTCPRSRFMVSETELRSKQADAPKKVLKTLIGAIVVKNRVDG